MPISKYDRWYGGKKGSAAKARAAMRKQYGAAEGDRVFYATMNKRRNQGDARNRGGDGLRKAMRTRREKPKRARQRRSPFGGGKVRGRPSY